MTQPDQSSEQGQFDFATSPEVIDRAEFATAVGRAAASTEVIKRYLAAEDSGVTRVEPRGEFIDQPVVEREFLPLKTPQERLMEGHGWVPYSRGEVTLANRGLEPQVNRGIKTHIGAVEDTLKQADDYQDDASRAVSTLLRATYIGGDGKKQVDLHQVTGDPHILEVVAKHQLFASKYANLSSWPRLDSKKFLAELSAEMRRLERADQQTLLSLYQGAMSSQTNRLKFWTDQHGVVQGHPTVLMARAEANQRVSRGVGRRS
jgi:hypothetical protein